MVDTARARRDLEGRIRSSLTEARFIQTALDIVADVFELAAEASDQEGAIRKYYEATTGEKPYLRPRIRFRARKARVILMARDSLSGREPKKRYAFGVDIVEHVAFDGTLAAFKAWMESRGLAESTVCSMSSGAKVLLVYLEDRGVTSLGGLCPQGLVEFIAWLGARYSPIGKLDVLHALRGLFSCPAVARELTFDPAGLLCNLRTPKHGRIPSVYSGDEVRMILGAIDRDTDAGRTLYLIATLAAVYGLRSGDIKRLRVDEIDFKAGVIETIQHKTGVPLRLPLVDDVKLPLLDYMMHTRRDCGCAELLVKHKGPAGPYSLSTRFHRELMLAVESSGIDLRGRRVGLHALRHSLATGMLASGVPVNEISAVLGHRSAETTKAYIWSDVEHLRIAALEVE